ncbi:MAG: hypothetical protein CMK06_12225 [Ponticaulis sp.]|nr:hypothetical protein [Ponticaulis sp.]
MTDRAADGNVYDPEHPWLKDAKDDPSRANWLHEFGDPTGTTRQPVFLRGQMMLALVRGGIFIATMFLVGSNPWLAAGIAFAGLGLVLVASLCQHVRRLNDSGRPAFLAAIIAIPMLLSVGLGVMGLTSVPEKLEQAQAASGKRPTAPPQSKAAADSEGAATEVEDAAAEAEAKPAPRAQRGRGGPPKPVTQESLIAGVIQSSLFIWLITSLATMAFSLFYVSRRSTVERP